MTTQKGILVLVGPGIWFGTTMRRRPQIGDHYNFSFPCETLGQQSGEHVVRDMQPRQWQGQDAIHVIVNRVGERNPDSTSYSFQQLNA